MGAERGAPGSAAPIGRPVPGSAEGPQVKIVLTEWAQPRHLTEARAPSLEWDERERKRVGERFEVADRLRGCRRAGD